MCPRVYLCPFDDCEETFTDELELENHQNTHNLKRVFTCNQPDCDKSYSLKQHLKRHIEKCHELRNSINYPCNLCPKILKTEDTLKKHIKRIHSSDRLKCSHCGKQFRKVQQLKIHEYDHTGIKSFVCTVEGCGRSFLLPSKLKIHEKVHKGYKCTEENCDLTFPTWTLLRKHSISHPRKFECDVCGRSFQRKSNLNTHTSTHKDLRQCFNCPYENCPRYYYFKNNLEQHIRNYHEDKKLACPNSKCTRKFCNKAKLDHHLSLNLCDKKKKIKARKRKRSLAAKLCGYKSDEGIVSSASDIETSVKELLTDLIPNSPARSVA